MKHERFPYMMDHGYSLQYITGNICEWWGSHRKPSYRFFVLPFLHLAVEY